MNSYNKIEILATLGPSSLNETVIQQLSEKGVTLFRINLSHTPLEEVESTIKKIQQYTSVPICLDSEGAQIRNQSMEGGQVLFKCGEKVKIHFSSTIGDSHNISFTPHYVGKSLKTGDLITIDFHSACLEVVDVCDDFCVGEVRISGRVGSNKAVDVNKSMDLEPISEKDISAIKIAKKIGVTHFALSFASSNEDVRKMRGLVGSNSRLISKIESKKGLINLEEILEATDAILIDRGDLSRQIPIEKIPLLQRKIIAIAKSKKTPVYVATNLLESMILNHQPTRAEANDVISTLLMGANGLVLAAETAIGIYPVETIEMVNKLIGELRRWTPNSRVEDIIS